MRFIKWIVLAVLVLLIVVGVGLWFYKDAATVWGIEYSGEYATGQATEVESASLAMWDQELNLEGLKVANPEGFEAEHFLQIERGDVAVGASSLMEDQVVVPSLTLSGVDLVLEKRDGKFNYQQIMEHMEGLSQPDQPGRRYIIHDLRITDITVHSNALPTGEGEALRTFKLPDIHLTDVGSDTEAGVLLPQLSGLVVESLMQNLAQHGPALVREMIGNELEGLLDQVQIGGVDLTGLGQQVEERATQEVGKALEGLLQREEKP